MELVEPADHADVLRDPPAGLGQVGVAAHARRGERLHRVGVHRRDVFQDRHHAAAGVVGDPLAGAVGQGDQLAVVGGHELVEHPRRDHRRRGAAPAKLENVVAGARQRLDEHLLPPKQDAQQLVDPRRVVVGLHDQPLDADQAGGVLPGAGLAEDVEAADVAAHQPPLAERRRPRG